MLLTTTPTEESSFFQLLPYQWTDVWD